MKKSFLTWFFFSFLKQGEPTLNISFFTTPHPHILTIYTYLKLVLFLVRTMVTKSWPLCRLQMSMFDNSNLTTTCFHIKILFFFLFHHTTVSPDVYVFFSFFTSQQLYVLQYLTRRRQSPTNFSTLPQKGTIWDHSMFL